MLVMENIENVGEQNRSVAVRTCSAVHQTSGCSRYKSGMSKAQKLMGYHLALSLHFSNKLSPDGGKVDLINPTLVPIN